MFLVYALYTFLIIIFILIFTFLIEEISLYKKLKKIEPPGTFIDSPNGKIHLIQKGSGKNSVIFSAGLSSYNPYCEFTELQTKTSNLTNSLIFENYGQGFSDITSKTMSLDDIVENIKNSLKSSDSKKTYIFVCNSSSSLEFLRYAEKYPDEVLGIILVDGLSPTFFNDIHKISTFKLRIMQFLKFTGILHLIGAISKSRKNKIIDKNSALSEINSTLFNRNFLNENYIKEIKDLKKNSEIVLNDKNSLLDIPLVVLSSKYYRNIPKKYIDKWIESQKDMISLSNKSKQIQLDNSEYPIHIENQDIILIAIQEILYNL